jgi:hypothetical protein
VAADTWGLSWGGTTGSWLSSWASTFVPPAPPDEPEVTHAGRKTRRKRYYVEIDGQSFPVESIQQAQALLDRAKALARNHAQRIASEIIPSVNRAGTKPIALPTPTIRSPDPELREAIRATHEVINEVYRTVALDTELALLLARSIEEQDEEDALLLLL